MKIGMGGGFLISLVIVAVAGFALLLTGVWYSVIIGGIVASLLIRKGYLISTLSSFIGGIISVAIVLLTLPIGYVVLTLNEVAIISGIGGPLLIILMILVTSALTLSGSLIGTFIAKNTIKGISNA